MMVFLISERRTIIGKHVGHNSFTLEIRKMASPIIFTQETKHDMHPK